MKHFLMMLTLLLMASPAFARSNQVVVTIKPLHSLVTSVTQGTDINVVLMARAGNSIHDYTLKPSDMAAMQKSDLIFYMGLKLETFMRKVVDQIPRERFVDMVTAPSMSVYPLRYAEMVKDMHLWMLPSNSIAMVEEISAKLSETYPEYKEIFSANAKKTQKDIAELDARLARRTEPLQGRFFVVFHEAYTYFTRHYQLDNIGNIGSIMGHNHNFPSAARLQNMRQQIIDTGTVCIFSEPEFDPAIVEALLQGTNAKTAILDPEGALLEPGPDLYVKLMEGIAAGMESCLK